VFVPPERPADEPPGSPSGGGGGAAARSGPVSLPPGFAYLPAGAELAAALEQVPLALISGHDTVDVVKAAHRQSCRSRAWFLLALLETGLRRPGSASTVARDETPGEFASDEARAALVWSRRRADRAFNLAWDVFVRFPMLGEAMLSGDLDEPRAAAFTTWTAGLTEDQAGFICAQLVARAPQLMVGELIEHITRMAIEIDPDWAERRYRDSVRRRRVVGARNDDGTASVAGLDLPIDRASAACDRIDELARACKRAGDRRRINHIRADLFLGMLDGTFETMTEAEIIANILAQAQAESAAADGPDGGGASTTRGDERGGGRRGRAQPRNPDDGGSGGGGPSGGGPSGGGPSGGGPSGGGPSGGGSGGEGPGDDDPSSDGGMEDRRRGDGDLSDGDLGDGGSDEREPGQSAALSDDAEPIPGNLPGSQHDDDVVNPAADGGQGDVPAGVPSLPAQPTQWAPREVRVQLFTLLGLNSNPAHVPGWGFLPAGVARTTVANMTRGEWRYVVCDTDGNPVDAGIIRARPGPTAARPRRDSRRGGVVEVHLSAGDLTDLPAVSVVGSDWAVVLAEIARRHGRFTGSRAAAGVRAGSGVDPRRRTASARLRRWVFVRDRCCVHPACRMPASRTDQDHAVDHASGGPTRHDNLGSCCRHDHRLQHAGGWRVQKPDPHTTVWYSPLGHQYVSRPPPVIPRPMPQHPSPPPPANLGTGIRGSTPVTHPCGCEGACECEPTLPPETSGSGSCPGGYQPPGGPAGGLPPF
jgi:hypothetical protein